VEPRREANFLKTPWVPVLLHMAQGFLQEQTNKLAIFGACWASKNQFEPSQVRNINQTKQDHEKMQASVQGKKILSNTKNLCSGIASCTYFRYRPSASNS